jgi:predicted amidophosphoribosyltransferase
VVVAIAPGHEANPNPTGFMHEIVQQLLAAVAYGSCPVPVEYCPLFRTTTVEKQSMSQGLRSEATHRGTIGTTTANNSGKVVLILDDVWTSGSTLRVCKEVVDMTNPKEVKLIAIGKTV